MTREEHEADRQAYRASAQEARARNALLAGEELRPVTAATTVRIRLGKTAVTDGPFAEAKEQLGGFFLVECQNLDEAIELAAKLPTAKYGSIEIRPVVARL
jgi:hypothetical protein